MKILVWFGKDTTEYINATDTEKAAAYLLRHKVENGYIENDVVEKAIANGKALNLLRRDRDNEYEHFHIEELIEP